MHLARVATVSGALLLSCNRDTPKPAPPSPAPSSPPAIQVRIGPRPLVENEVPFVITTVYAAQKPDPAAPWHTVGGDWTFFDAATRDGASFVFGFHRGKTEDVGAGPMVFGDAILGAKDRESGARFASTFAAGFHVPLPALPAEQKAPTVLKPSIVFLAENAGRAETGGFSGTGGGWTATKLTIERGEGGEGGEGGEEEVFFNFNLTMRLGELTEKDEAYDRALEEDVTAAMRDGTFL